MCSSFCLFVLITVAAFLYSGWYNCVIAFVDSIWFHSLCVDWCSVALFFSSDAEQERQNIDLFIVTEIFESGFMLVQAFANNDISFSSYQNVLLTQQEKRNSRYFFLRCLAKRSILSTIKSTLLPPYFILKRQIQTAFDNRKCYYAYTLADVGRLRRLQFQSHPIHWFLLFFSINISPRRCCASQRNAIFALTAVQFKTRLFHFSVFFFVSAFFSRRTTFAMNNHAHGQIAQVKAFCLSGGWIIKRIPFWSRKIAATTTELHRLKFYAKAKYRKLALTETNKRNCSNE